MTESGRSDAPAHPTAWWSPADVLTAVRVPVFFGHSEAVHIETRRKITAARARALLEEAPGVEVMDEHEYMQEWQQGDMTWEEYVAECDVSNVVYIAQGGQADHPYAPRAAWHD